MEFFRDGVSILKEYSRDGIGSNDHSGCMRFSARNFKPVSGCDYDISMRFEADGSEKIYGMGQYQRPNLNLKGCVRELAQRKSQISIPFYLSSKGYGFLWNNEGIGEVMFGANYTQWHSLLSEELDYWITADENPKKNHRKLHRRYGTRSRISRQRSRTLAVQAPLPHTGRGA